MGMVLRPQTFGELVQFANIAARSGMVPRDYANKPEAIVIAVQMGSELGLAPMQALQNISVVNGRPSVWGDALPGLCRQSALCQDIEEWTTGEGDDLAAHCKVTRRGASPVTQTFSVSDAKRAGLWGKAGPWQQYSRRMLQMRARGFALRDAFPDVLRGLITAEEAQDIPADTFRGTTLDARAEPTSAGQAIDDAIPDRVMDQPAPGPRKPTAREWLDQLRADLAAAADAEAVDAIIARDDVQRALDRLQNGAKDDLNAMIKAALDRTATPVEDTAETEAL
jgi:hypothetical protein